MTTQKFLRFAAHLFFLLCGFLLSASLNAQIVFGPEQVISTSSNGVASVYTADLDNDGDIDLLPYHHTDGAIAWYENDGEGNFGDGHIIDYTTGSLGYIYVIDMDGDGDNDVVSISSFWDTDVLVVNTVWYPNDGEGNFGSGQTIAFLTEYPHYVHVIDMDSDGDNDVLLVTSWGGSIIAWYENDGAGNFGEEHIIGIITDGMIGAVYIADMDGDGDNDVFADIYMNPWDAPNMIWYENDGVGNFANEHIVDYSGDMMRAANIADMDNDGDNDIAITIYGDFWNDWTTTVVWRENDGAGNFGAEHIIDSLNVNEISIYISDLDNDGDNDMLTTYYPEDVGIFTLDRYKNDGSGNFSAEQTIYTKGLASTSFDVVDLDGDGDNDILAGIRSDWVEDLIVWYENDGSSNFGDAQIIDNDANFAGYVHGIDLDGDGDKDVLSAADYGMAWYENLSLSPTEALPPHAQFATTPLAASAAANPDTLHICNEQTVYFNNQSENANTYLWDFGDGSSTTQANPTHTYTQAGTYTVSLVAYSNTPEPFVCEADAGHATFGIEGGFGGIEAYNQSPNYTQIYFVYDTEGNLVSSHTTIWEARQAYGNEFVVAVNYLNGEVMPANTIAGLQQQVDIGECINFDVYGLCGLQENSANAVYNSEYGGYLISYNVGSVPPTNPPDDYGGYVLPYPVAYQQDYSWFGVYLYLLDTNYQPFTPGDTIHFCPLDANGATLCCQTIIIPGGGNPEPFAPTDPPIEPLYSSRQADDPAVLSDTTYLVVVVQPSLAPDITCIATLCANDTAQYHTSAVCSSYEWTVTGGAIVNGQGTTDIDVVWDDIPEGTVSLTANCGEGYCNLPTVVAVPILTPTADIAGKNHVCLNEVCQYTLPFFGGTTYNWTIDPPEAGSIIAGNNSNQISVRWTNMAATLIATYENQLLGCNGEASLSVTPTPAFAIDTLDVVCQGTQNTLHLTENGDFTWTIAGGNIVSAQNTDSLSVLWTDAGSFAVTATTNDTDFFCNTSSTATMTVLPYPQSPSIVGEAVVCPAQTYVYTATPMQNNTTFVWTISGGTILSGQNTANVSVIWDQTPPYSLSLVRQTNSTPACTSTPTVLAVNSVADMGGLSIAGSPLVCPASSHNYTATPNVPNLWYEWSITPETAGQIVQGQGTAQITVQWTANEPSGDIVLSVAACDLSVSYDIAFGTVPQPIIAQNTVLCSNNTVELSVGNVTDISEYSWQNENGDFLSAAPTLSISDGGTYSVVVSNNAGCSGYANIGVTENTAPIAQILSPSYIVCIQEPVNISLWAIDGTNYSFEWLLDGAPIAGADTPFNTHIGTDVEDSFAYRVRVTDTQNACVTLSNIANIIQTVCVPDTSNGGGGLCSPNNPDCPLTDTHEVGFNLQTIGTNCQMVELNNLSVGDFTEFVVSWGDGSSDVFTGSSITHTYSGGINLYSVLLRGGFIHPITNNPCYKTHAEVHPVPLAARFDVTAACLGNEWHFQDRSYYLPITSISNWTWDFGDGSPTVSGSQTADHAYSTAGDFDVTLTITDGNCTVSAT